MHARRATSLVAALLVAVLPALADTVVAPASLRQGDPLLAWIVTEGPVTEGPVAEGTAAEGEGASGVREARLVNAAGKTVSIARCFDAAAALEGASAPLATEPLAPEPPAAAGTQSTRRLLGALMALPPDLPPGAYRLVVGTRAGAREGAREIAAFAPIAVEARAFAIETIALDQANAAIRTVPSKRKDEEARVLFALLKRVDDSAVYAGGSPFLFPVEGGWKSAGFGDVRRYRYPDGSSDRSVHAGIDWAVVAGTPVRACARGRVVLAADREVTGKTLVVEHLPGLYSLYFHLSAIEVKQGDIVERGAPIALSGSTGMSTGPHLHWELRAKGDAVDPEYWLNAALLDKSAIATIITGLIEGR
jgi:murein DD-endopeptidase MepM/ murein hydrolase activator NlpD